LFHFGGILTAVTSTHPQSWVSGQLWNYIYRPYLQFVYLNNAYHFYSPEPGPASLLWFFVEYESDTPGTRYYRWVKVPHVKDGNPVPWRLKVQYYRRLSLTKSTNQPTLYLPPLYVQKLPALRLAEGERIGIPPHPDLPYESQYREPSHFSRYWMSAYARHVAKTYPHEQRPELPVKQIKIYRVVHRIIGAGEIAAGQRMYEKTTYLPYYQGTFDADGKLVEGYDPLRYWLIPIAYFPREKPRPETPSAFRMPITARADDEHYQLRNFLNIHVGLPE